MRTTRSIGFAAVVALAAIAFMVPSLVARQQTVTRWEYLRITPGLPSPVATFDMSQDRLGYQACQAKDTEWKCRDFESKDNQDDALRSALATLGAEGWELVSTVAQAEGVSYPSGLTYLLKRQQQ
jgi:hypothetical protein